MSGCRLALILPLSSAAASRISLRTFSAQSIRLVSSARRGSRSRASSQRWHSRQRCRLAVSVSQPRSPSKPAQMWCSVSHARDHRCPAAGPGKRCTKSIKQALENPQEVCRLSEVVAERSVWDQVGDSLAASVICGSWNFAMWNRQYLRTTSGHVAAPKQFSHLRSVRPVVFCRCREGLSASTLFAGHQCIRLSTAWIGTPGHLLQCRRGTGRGLIDEGPLDKWTHAG